MAKKLSKAGISTNETIQAWHVTQSVDALTGDVGYDVSISGSLGLTGSLAVTGIGGASGDPGYDRVLLWNKSTGDVKPTQSAAFIDTIDTGSLLVTGSVEESIITLEKGDGSTFTLQVETGSAAILTQELESNQNVGGVTSGDVFDQGSTIEALLRSMLITYIAPTISGLSVGITVGDSDTTRDVGNGFTMDQVSFSATQDSPDGNYPFSSSISSTGAETGPWSEDFDPAPLAGSNTKSFSFGDIAQNIVTTSGTINYTVSAKSQNTGNIITTSKSYNFRWRNYLCASATDIISNGTANDVISEEVDNQLDTNRSWTATCTSDNDDGTKYTYIIYPSSYGDLSGIIQDGATPVLGAFTKQTDRTITNAYGSTVSVRIYKSNAPGAFAAGTTLEIS